MTWKLWIDHYEGHSGIIASRAGAPNDQRLVKVWPDDASAFEIAQALEMLAADLRRQHARSTQEGTK